MKECCEGLRATARGLAIVGVSMLATATVATSAAQARPHRHRHAAQQSSFQHVGTFSVPANLQGADDRSIVTSAEIVDVSKDGKTLIYTDSPAQRLGFVDITSPSSPTPAGIVELGGEPTSVAVAHPWVLAAVNTSKDPDGDGPLNEYDAPTGELVVIRGTTRRVERRIPLAGQPDSIAISPDARFAAIVIENERDEDENDGLLPQLPAGTLQVIELRGGPSRWQPETIALTGLAEVAPDDPEPEFVDINSRNLAVVSMQENNHLVVVDLAQRSVLSHFSAGSVTIENVDATEEELGPDEAGLISPSETITRRREPDAVAWIDEDTFATANEGDYEDANGDEGGSRGFTLFNVSGAVEFESGSAFEHELVRIGHYPEARSENKGVEPEGLEVGVFAGRKLLFVGSERGNAVGVYDVTDGEPTFVQVLPTGIGPEGIKAIPQRGLLAVSSEVDGFDDGFDIRSLVTVYQLGAAQPAYPMLQSANDASGLPIPWVAISGLGADREDAGTVWAVSDSFLAQGYLYRIDVTSHPAEILERIAIGEADGLLDLEGVAARPEGGFWLASEGKSGVRPNALLRVDADGAILQQVELPAELVANMTNSGFEGVAVTGSDAARDETLWAVVQREWKDDEAGFVKLARYDVASASWSFALYPLDAVESPNGGWVGLSEITLLPDGSFLIDERDNQIALDARIKRLYKVDLASVAFAAYGAPLPVVSKTLVRDVLPDLDAHSISVPDKIEGVCVTLDGQVYVATDNDGLDENYGETLFFSLGSVDAL